MISGVKTLLESFVLARLLLDGAPAPAQAAAPPSEAAHLAKATFAGGCFWCMQKPFDELPGVVSTTAGYTGGHLKDPTYEQVSSGGTGHAESVQILYDPRKVSYEKLLDVFWHNVDPTSAIGQFCDRGEQYRSIVFFHDEAQKRSAGTSRGVLAKSPRFKGTPIVTEIVVASTFYPAEGYHQSYYKKNPIRYSFYRKGCGRDARLREIWGEGAGH